VNNNTKNSIGSLLTTFSCSNVQLQRKQNSIRRTVENNGEI